MLPFKKPDMSDAKNWSSIKCEATKVVCIFSVFHSSSTKQCSVTKLIISWVARTFLWQRLRWQSGKKLPLWFTFRKVAPRAVLSRRTVFFHHRISRRHALAAQVAELLRNENDEI